MSGETTALLSYGDTGDAVAAVQHELQHRRGRDLRPADRGGGQELAGRAGPRADRHRRRQDLGVAVPGEGAVLRRLVVAATSVKASFGGAIERRADLGALVRLDRRAGSLRPRGAQGRDHQRPGAGRGTRVRARGDLAGRDTGDGCSTDGRIVAPVSGGTITGHYGEDRGDHAHSGTDIAVPTGTTVRAADCGTVSMSGTESGYGADGLRPARRRDDHVLRPPVRARRLRERVRQGRAEDRRGRLHRQLHRPARALRGAPGRHGHEPRSVPEGRAVGQRPDRDDGGGLRRDRRRDPGAAGRGVRRTGGTAAPEATKHDQLAAATRPAGGPGSGPAPAGATPAPGSGRRGSGGPRRPRRRPAPAPVAEAPAPRRSSRLRRRAPAAGGPGPSARAAEARARAGRPRRRHPHRWPRRRRPRRSSRRRRPAPAPVAEAPGAGAGGRGAGAGAVAEARPLRPPRRPPRHPLLKLRRRRSTASAPAVEADAAATGGVAAP